jgi:type I restriction enzyme, S subunit
MEILGEHIVIQKGKMPRNLSDNQSKKFKHPYIDIKAFEKGNLRRYTDGEKCLLCDSNDILIVWDGARCGLVGKAISGAVGSTLAVIKPKENVQREYVYYFLKSQFLTFNTRVKGVGIPHLDPFLVHHSSLIIPSLPEQHRIVEKLEELLSELEKGKEQLNTALDQLKVYRQAVLKYAFESIVNPHITTIKGCCTHIIDCLHSTAKFQNSGYYCVDTTCIENSKILFDKLRYVDKRTYEERISRLKPQEGDILFAREGTVGTTLIVPKGIQLCLGQRMMMFRLKQTIESKYFAYYFQAPQLKIQYKPMITGTTSPHINIRDIKMFKMIVCSLEDQHRVVEEIERRLSVADKLEETITASLQQSETLRQSILKKAFEGKLV